MQSWRRHRLPSQARQPARPAGASETASFRGLHLTQLMLREVRGHAGMTRCHGLRNTRMLDVVAEMCVYGIGVDLHSRLADLVEGVRTKRST